MSTSTEGRTSVVLRDLPSSAVTVADTSVDLRGGEWTRFGSSGVRGDRVTEATLRGLAEQSRAAAHAQGFASGWAEGRRGSLAATTAVQDEKARVFDEQCRRAMAAQQSAAEALGRAAARVEDGTRHLQSELNEQVVELALQIAEAVLGRELRAMDDPAGEAILRALDEVPVDVPLTVHLHPADLAVLDQDMLAESVPSERAVTYVADPAVATGDALVETESGLVDAGLSSALRRVREVLG